MRLLANILPPPARTARCNLRQQARRYLSLSTAMAPRKDSIPHETRTAAEPRQNKLYPVRLVHVEQANPTIRLLRLALPAESSSDDEATDSQPQEPFSFLPGQWLDVHVPGIQQAGGFTITSTPADAQQLPTPDPTVVQDGTDQLADQHGEIGVPTMVSRGRYPYVELAVQNSPSNPPAAWLWRPKGEILGREVNVRVGGSFVWPPAASVIRERDIREVLFVAGGVGINPLISILSHITEPHETTTAPSIPPLHDQPRHEPLSIHFLYTTRVPQATTMSSKDITYESLDEILFLSRLRQIVQRVSSHKTKQPSSNLKLNLDLYLTNVPASAAAEAEGFLRGPSKLNSNNTSYNNDHIRVRNRRINKQDLYEAASRQPDRTVSYVCGPPPMTDEFVGYLNTLLDSQRVLCEKWW
ncbi:hypothetical protein BGW36DRAFT_379352 [Talaromyces proteolyticus]|uniref:FAD-binding FR-type domain-containing protein n=1 Tax=Talaromyces proteolyticus TaxID=1131652 RepID=A0AAD4Q0M7_9EURO|nr:uncharacterized protein BGW36DRAFT_379352 [Talaromyces proteolyticus]KAH8697742.1 hypothetical protein BGW36DRAFT_379352 [Talaromyces proteolyticus]